MPNHLPFAHHTHQCFVYQPKKATGNARHAENGYATGSLYAYRVARCAYCSRRFDVSYRAFLDLSVDHVVPVSVMSETPDVAPKKPKPWPYDKQVRSWLLHQCNTVPCCRACNEFLNGFTVGNEAMPKTPEQFALLRDKVFQDKRRGALSAHAQERKNYRAFLTKVAQL